MTCKGTTSPFTFTHVSAVHSFSLLLQHNGRVYITSKGSQCHINYRSYAN